MTKTNDTRRVELCPLHSLRPAARNPKKHRLDALQENILRRGLLGPVATLDERTGRMVAGHGRVAALRALERQDPNLLPDGVRVTPEGDWLVPVWRGWASADDTEAEAVLVADNRLTEAGGWDADPLALVLQDLQKADALAGTGYSSAEVDKLLGVDVSFKAKGRGGQEPEGDPLEGLEDVGPTVEAGELWALGDHRLLCGDSLSADLDRLLAAGEQPAALITDPPYAIYGSSSGIASDIADDAMVRPFFEAIHRTAFRVLPWFAHVYLCCDWRSWASIWETAKRAPIAPRNMLVWDKGGSGLGSMWGQSHELIFFGVKVPQETAMGHREAGMRTVYKPNVLRHARPSGDERMHNAAKPVAMMLELVEAATDAGQTVLELFTGSGSTLIACEQSGRRCLAMEKNPTNATITVRRWERDTGRKAVRL